MPFCKNCGKELPSDAICCPNCGERQTEAQTPPVNQSAPVSQPTPTYQPPVAKPHINVMAIVWFAVGGLELLLSIIAGFMIMGGAGDMSTLRSVGGESVAEYFYQYSGAVNKGIAVAVFAFGFFGGGIFARFGFKEAKK